MSLDIASSVADLPERAIHLTDLDVVENAIYAFDFDGVVVSSEEDDVYHLDTWDGEESLLARVANRFRLRCEDMEVKYQRHLIYQACAYYLGKPIEVGVGFQHAKRASEIGRLFLITARSGWYAVERMRRFLSESGIVPLEVFNLGRVKKDRQLDLLCREFPDSHIYYIEDNKAHLAAVKSLGHDNLSLVWAARAAPKKDPKELRRAVVEMLETVLD